MKKWLRWLVRVLMINFYVYLVFFAHERLLMFAPSIGIIAFIAAVVIVYLRYAAKRWFPKEKIGSVEWINENKEMVAWRISAPMVCIYAPTFEELMYRGPLLLLFASLTSSAWVGIGVSAFLFGIMHWFGPKTDISEMKNFTKTDDISAAIKEAQERQPKLTLIKRSISVLAACVLGAVAGYYTIVYQSLWAGVAVHFVWNLVVPIMLPLMILSITLVVMGIIGGVSNMYWRIRNRKARKTIERLAISRTSISHTVYRPELDEGVPLRSEDDKGQRAQ